MLSLLLKSAGGSTVFRKEDNVIRRRKHGQLHPLSPGSRSIVALHAQSLPACPHIPEDGLEQS